MFRLFACLTPQCAGPLTDCCNMFSFNSRLGTELDKICAQNITGMTATCKYPTWAEVHDAHASNPTCRATKTQWLVWVWAMHCCDPNGALGQQKGKKSGRAASLCRMLAAGLPDTSWVSQKSTSTPAATGPASNKFGCDCASGYWKVLFMLHCYSTSGMTARPERGTCLRLWLRPLRSSRIHSSSCASLTIWAQTCLASQQDAANLMALSWACTARYGSTEHYMRTETVFMRLWVKTIAWEAGPLGTGVAHTLTWA